MTDTVFRTAETSQTDTVVASTPTESTESVTVANGKGRPLSPFTYRETTGKPYLAKILEVENVYDDLDKETTTDIDFIEDYFKGLVSGKKAQNDSVSYKEIFGHLEKVVNAKFDPMFTKVKKIADFIKTIKRAKEYARQTK